MTICYSNNNQENEETISNTTILASALELDGPVHIEDVDTLRSKIESPRIKPIEISTANSSKKQRNYGAIFIIRNSFESFKKNSTHLLNPPKILNDLKV